MKGLGPTEQLISPEPEITVLNRNKELDEIIVLACDGIWDVLSNEALCTLLQHRMRCTDDLSLVCNETIDMCLYKVSVLYHYSFLFACSPLVYPEFH